MSVALHHGMDARDALASATATFAAARAEFEAAMGAIAPGGRRGVTSLLDWPDDDAAGGSGALQVFHRRGPGAARRLGQVTPDAMMLAMVR